MDVVAHQDIRMQAATKFFGLFPQVSQIFLIMNLKDEAGSAIHASLDDVLGDAG
jgi:hypothetical protein